MKGEIIIALDVEDISSAQKYVKMLKGDVSFFKIGS